MKIEKIKSVEELLKELNLSTEELEMHKELIEESKEREQIIIESCEEAKNNLQKLSGVFSSVMEKLEESSQLLEGIELMSIPEKEFHKA